jgi:hypothetical protein
MGVPTSEVGYTSATTRRETTKSMTDMWWHGKTTTTINIRRTCKEEKHIHREHSTLTSVLLVRKENRLTIF